MGCETLGNVLDSPKEDAVFSKVMQTGSTRVSVISLNPVFSTTLDGRMVSQIKWLSIIALN